MSTVTDNYEQNLPPDLVEELLAAKRKQAIAMELAKVLSKGIDVPGATGNQRIASRVTPLAALAHLGAQWGNSGALADAERGIADVRRRGEEQFSQGIQQYQNSKDPQSGIAALLASQNPRLRAFGAGEQTYQRKLSEETEKHKVERERIEAQNRKTSSDEGLKLAGQLFEQGRIDEAQQVIQAIANRQPLPKFDLSKPSVPNDELISQSIPGMPNPVAAVQSTDPKTRAKTLKPIGGGINVSANASTAPKDPYALDAWSARTEDLKKVQIPAARKAMEVVGNTSLTISELERAAQAGPGQDIMQLVRKGASFLGLTDKDLEATMGSTDAVKKLLADRAIAKAGELKPVSNVDMEFLRSQVGDINTPQEALPIILAWYQAQAIKQIYDTREELNSGGPTDLAGEELRKLGRSIQMPPLTGPTWWQVKVGQNLMRMGVPGEVLQIGGQPFAPGGQIPRTEFQNEAFGNRPERVTTPAPTTASSSGVLSQRPKAPPPGAPIEQQRAYVQALEAYLRSLDGGQK